MPKVTIEANLTNTAPWDGTSSILPPSEYVFEVADCIVKPPSKAGNFPQLEFDLSVVAGADSDQFNGVEKKHWVSLSPKAAGRLRNILDACGVTFEVDAQGQTSFDSDQFKGAQFIAEVFTEEYDKPDLNTGETKTVTNSKIRKERRVEEGWSDSSAPTTTAAPAASTPAPAAAAPAARTATRAPAAAPAAATTAAPAQASLPKVTAGNPPRRPPIPPRRPAGA